MNQCNRTSVMFILYIIFIHIKKLLFFIFNLRSSSMTLSNTTPKSKFINKKSFIKKSSNTSSISTSSSSSSSSSTSSSNTADEVTDINTPSQDQDDKTNSLKQSNDNNSNPVNSNTKELKTNTKSIDTSVNNNNKSINKNTEKNNKIVISTKAVKNSSTTEEKLDTEISKENNTQDNENKQVCRIRRAPSSAVRRRRKEKKILVLDLDETLIHSTSRGSRNHDYMIEVLVDKHICLYYVYKRPYVDNFLKKVSEWYKVVVFTASLKEYADPVIDYLDPEKKIFAKRYFRESCQFRNGIYMKDLQIIEKDLSKICLVDNSSFSYEINKENGIPIETWINDPKDRELLNLLPFLDALRFVEDVRSILSLRL